MSPARVDSKERFNKLFINMRSEVWRTGRPRKVEIWRIIIGCKDLKAGGWKISHQNKHLHGKFWDMKPKRRVIISRPESGRQEYL